MNNIKSNKDFVNFTKNYIDNINNLFNDEITAQIKLLADDIQKSWLNRSSIYICGNGGSAGNAMHIANDFHYGVGCNSNSQSPGIRFIALPSNPSIITCLANDIGYENIYSHQLEVLAEQSDILIVLSGSGNSANVINALQYASTKKIKSYAVLAFDGGQCKNLADVPIHFKINDMQIAEDVQLILFHICMQWIKEKSSQNAK